MNTPSPLRVALLGPGLLAAALPLLAAGFAVAQSSGSGCSWVERRGPFPSGFGWHGAHDPVRQRIVTLGGSRTWEWNGDGWNARYSTVQPIPGPSSRRHPRLAFDASMGEIVLFGGEAGSTLMGDTWAYDGEQWRNLGIVGPSPRSRFGLAYDASRQQLVLFGGRTGSSSQSNETWEWDGQMWALRASSGPSARQGHAMAYDSIRQRTVLFGGSDGGPLPSPETWEWDGAAWQLRANTGPAGRTMHTLVFDPLRQRTILFGGTSQASHNHLWEWDGNAWVERPLPAPGEGPEPRSEHLAAFDESLGAIVIAGGIGLRDTWSWNGHQWKLLTQPGPIPGWTAAVAYDTIRKETLHISNYSPQLWGWDGDQWRLRSTQLESYLSEGAAAAFDQERGELVLFMRGQTWLWNGLGWDLRVNPPGFPAPAMREWHAMGYDAARKRIVMHGGQQFVWPGGWTIFYDDTWEWDGDKWVEVSIPGPGSHSHHRLAYDTANQVMVMLTNTGETWTYNGLEWTLAGTGGPARSSHTMAYHPIRQRVMLFGGLTGSPYPADDMWEWDGQTWSELLLSGPERRSLTHMTWDADRGRMIMVGGASDVSHHGPLEQTWELICDPAPCYANCDGGTIPPILNINDFTCFINEFASASTLPHSQQLVHYANCDGSTTEPVLNVDDFTCFINQFAAGCP